MQIFGSHTRTDTAPGRHSDTPYQFLDRSARPEVAEIRRLLETWFSEYPQADRAELQARFVADFHSAFFELLLHAYFRIAGFDLEPHPVVSGTTKRPDFLVSKGECRFYLEAIVARDISSEEAGKRNVKNLLLDAINDAKSPNFFLALRDFTIVPGEQPSAKRLNAYLTRELGKIDPDSIDIAQFNNPLFDGPTITYQDSAITVVISLIPRSPATRGRADIRPIGIYPIESRWGGSDTLLRAAINAKATRYGDPDIPFVVAVNCISEWGLDDGDVLNALFGTEQFTFVQGSSTPIPSRKRDGALIGPNGPWNTRVSGVLVASALPPSLASCRFELYNNPWAKRSLDGCTFEFRQGSVQNGSIQWTGSTDLPSHFGLHPNWPAPPAAA